MAQPRQYRVSTSSASTSSTRSLPRWRRAWGVMQSAWPAPSQQVHRADSQHNRLRGALQRSTAQGRWQAVSHTGQREFRSQSCTPPQGGAHARQISAPLTAEGETRRFDRRVCPTVCLALPSLAQPYASASKRPRALARQGAHVAQGARRLQCSRSHWTSAPEWPSVADGYSSLFSSGMR
jgi:hypothetical protein